MAIAMMKPTQLVVAMMEVTVVEVVPTQIIVQIVSVMQGHQQVLTVSKIFNLFQPAYPLQTYSKVLSIKGKFLSEDTPNR